MNDEIDVALKGIYFKDLTTIVPDLPDGKICNTSLQKRSITVV